MPTSDCAAPAATPTPPTPPPPRIPGDWGIWPVLVGLLALLPPVLLIVLLAQAPIPLSLLTALSATLLGLVQIALVWALALRSPRRSPALIELVGLVGLTTTFWPLRRAIRNSIATLTALAASIGFSWLYATAVGVLGWDFLLPEPPPAGIILPGGLAIITFIALAIWTPLAEELFFRGFVMTGLVHRFGLPAGLPAAAAIFALLHLSLPNLLPIFVIGLLLGGLYRYTGSIWPGVFFHLTQNTLALTAVLLTPAD